MKELDLKLRNVEHERRDTLTEKLENRTQRNGWKKWNRNQPYSFIGNINDTNEKKFHSQQRGIKTASERKNKLINLKLEKQTPRKK